MSKSIIINKIQSLRPLNDTVLVADMTFDQRQLSSGIVLLNDDGKSHGIRPRWGRVYAIGPDQRDVQVGQWVLIAHGRWTRGIEVEDNSGNITLRKIDTKDILLVSNQMPQDDTMSTAISVPERSR
jgi:co-chaperonin GroES (HSP10)